LLQFVEDHNNVEDEMDTTDLVPENDPEEELLLSGVTFVEPSAAKTDIIPANAPEVESENLPLLEPATPTSTLPLKSDESNPAPEATTDTPLPDKPDAVARRARVLTKVVPKISKKSAAPKREKPRLIMPKVPPKKPGIPFISSKWMPKLPPQVKKPSEGPLQENMYAINKQIPLKRKIVEQRPHVLLLSDTKKELSKHFVDQLKGILNTVTPRPIYLVPRDSSKSPFLVIPEQLQSEIDKSSPLADKEKNSECEPTAAKKTRVVELKTGTTYEV
jgi:hypothetical protein